MLFRLQEELHNITRSNMMKKAGVALLLICYLTLTHCCCSDFIERTPCDPESVCAMHPTAKCSFDCWMTRDKEKRCLEFWYTDPTMIRMAIC